MNLQNGKTQALKMSKTWEYQPSWNRLGTPSQNWTCFDSANRCLKARNKYSQNQLIARKMPSPKPSDWKLLPAHREQGRYACLPHQELSTFTHSAFAPSFQHRIFNCFGVFFFFSPLQLTVDHFIWKIQTAFHSCFDKNSYKVRIGSDFSQNVLYFSRWKDK